MFSSKITKIIISLTLMVSLALSMFAASAASIPNWDNQVDITTLFSNRYYIPVGGVMTGYSGSPNSAQMWGFQSGTTDTLIPRDTLVSEFRWTVAGDYSLAGTYDIIVRVGTRANSSLFEYYVDPQAFSWSLQYTTYSGEIVSVPLTIGDNVSAEDDPRHWLSGSVTIPTTDTAPMDFAIIATAISSGGVNVGNSGQLFFVPSDFSFNPLTGDAAIQASINNAAQQIIDALDNLGAGNDYTGSLNDIISLVRSLYNQAVLIYGEIDEVEDYLNSLGGYLSLIVADLSNNGHSIAEWVTTISVDMTSLLASFNAFRSGMEDFTGSYWDEFTEQREALQDFFDSFVNSDQYNNVINQGSSVNGDNAIANPSVDSSYSSVNTYFEGVVGTISSAGMANSVQDIGQLLFVLFNNIGWLVVMFSWFTVLRVVKHLT